MKVPIIFIVILLIGLSFGAIPTDENGNVGATSYISLPFTNNVFIASWDSSPFLTPGQLFFQSDPKSDFNSPSAMAIAASSSNSYEAKGIIPSLGAQRWEDTYLASLPPGRVCTNESLFPQIGTDRGTKTGAYNTTDTNPAYSSWANWIYQRWSKYKHTAYDGKTLPYNAKEQQYNYVDGHISMVMPLDPADVPSDLGPTPLSQPTYGDLWAYQYAKTTNLTHAYGIMLSDYSDSNPGVALLADFNPRIVAKFASLYNITVPGSSTLNQSRWIVANKFNEWIDFNCESYARFFKAVVDRISAATNRSALIIDQCGYNPQYRRMNGVDQRILFKYMSPKNYLCGWDEQSILVGRVGPIQSPISGELIGSVLSAAREPNSRNVPNIESPYSQFWQFMQSFYPSLNQSSLTECGNNLVLGLWTYLSWAHICDYNAQVRRAICSAQRDTFDQANLTTLDPLTYLVQNIYPVKPWGPALYYSVNIERAAESAMGVKAGAGGSFNFFTNTDMSNILDSGMAPIGYYISDAALTSPDFKKGATSAPSAFLVPKNLELMPPSELATLQAIAPVVNSTSALAALPNQRISFSGGICGFAFVANDGRLIVVARSPNPNPDAGIISGNLILQGLADGKYLVTELLSNTTLTTAQVSSGKATIPLTLPRWALKVYAFPAASLPFTSTISSTSSTTSATSQSSSSSSSSSTSSSSSSSSSSSTSSSPSPSPATLTSNSPSTSSTLNDNQSSGDKVTNSFTHLILLLFIFLYFTSDVFYSAQL